MDYSTRGMAPHAAAVDSRARDVVKARAAEAKSRAVEAKAAEARASRNHPPQVYVVYTSQVMY